MGGPKSEKSQRIDDYLENTNPPQAPYPPKAHLSFTLIRSPLAHFSN